MVELSSWLRTILASLELRTKVSRSLKANARPVSDSEEAARRVNQEKFDGIFL